MAKNQTPEPDTESTTDPTEKPSCGGGPSFSLLIVGLLALAVAAWAFIGPHALPTTSIPLGWVAVIAAVVIGALLVLSPRRR
ncbi:hypothetical protein [Nocardia callitridis]|uniref:Uncharacterized protein n=1 Tax=Nocardia callitridis TaxID=648753 RepID=A0ABP9L172_9NOCA